MCWISKMEKKTGITTFRLVGHSQGKRPVDRANWSGQAPPQSRDSRGALRDSECEGWNAA